MSTDDRRSVRDRIVGFFSYDPEKDQWSDRPVPEDQRKGTWGPTSVWIGFAIAYATAFVGAQIYFGLGMPETLYAILLGDVILVVYASVLAHVSAKGGLNFPLQVKEAFGQYGALIPVAMMGVLVNGWYAYQAWLAADVIRAAWGVPWIPLAIGITVLFGIPSLIGIGALEEIVQKLVIPSMVLFAVYMLITVVIPAGTGILNQPAPGESIPFMIGVGLAWGTFAVSGTATGDIVRFSSDSKGAIIATLVAFLVCNTGMMALGALIAATLPELNIYFGLIGVLGSIPLIVISFTSCWSTCDACHYGASMSYTNLHDKITWRMAGIAGMMISLVAVTTEFISNLVGLLVLIGIVVPPIGGVIIAEFLIVRKNTANKLLRNEKVNYPAILALIIAVLVNYYVFNNFQFIPTGLAGLVLSIIAYPIFNQAKTAMAGKDAVVESARNQAQPAETDD